ncbi:MAG: hypothetical protein NZL83_04540 [Candidatus Absconditabacterales bacterium]|nr:hypothetical protein [Candidatus Absconditabacterales bacterium]
MKKILGICGVVGLTALGGSVHNPNTATTKAAIATALTNPRQGGPHVLQLPFSSADTTTTTDSLQANSPYLDQQTNHILDLFFSDIMHILQHDKNDEALRELRRILVTPILHPRIPGYHNTTAFINRANMYLPQELLDKFNKAIDAQTQPLFRKDGFLAQGGRDKENNIQDSSPREPEKLETLYILMRLKKNTLEKEQGEKKQTLRTPDTIINELRGPLNTLLVSIDQQNNNESIITKQQPYFTMILKQCYKLLGNNMNHLSALIYHLLQGLQENAFFNQAIPYEGETTYDPSQLKEYEITITNNNLCTQISVIPHVGSPKSILQLTFTQNTLIISNNKTPNRGYVIEFGGE